MRVREKVRKRLNNVGPAAAAAAARFRSSASASAAAANDEQQQHAQKVFSRECVLWSVRQRREHNNTQDGRSAQVHRGCRRRGDYESRKCFLHKLIIYRVARASAVRSAMMFK